MAMNSGTRKLFDHVSHIEPLLPEADAELASLPIALTRGAERLGRRSGRGIAKAA
jgi:hypothetical protein